MNNSLELDVEVTPLQEAMPAHCPNIMWRSEFDWRADDTSLLQDESVPLILADGTSEAATVDRTTPTREIAAGTRLRSRYILEEIIGRGGESVVFRARDLHRISSNGEAGTVAIKLLLDKHHANPRALERLRRAFWQMQSLTHPGITRVFDLDCDGDIWFMTLELVSGQNLNSWMQGPFSTADALKRIAGCCEALEYAHSKGILHGDLKPANVMVTEDGGIKLIDFGSAPSAGAGLDEGRDLNAGTTLSYASPQVLLGSRAERCDDVFSLACLSYELLSRGGRPYAPKSMLEAHQEQMRPKYDAGIPPSVFQVVAAGLALERDQRPKTAREFLRRLTSFEPDHHSDLAPAEMSVSCGPSAAAPEEATRSPGSDPPLQLPPAEATPLTRNKKRVASWFRTETTALIADIAGSDYRAKGRMSLLGFAAAVILGTAALLLQALHSNGARTGESSQLARVQLPQRVLAIAPTLTPPSETVIPAPSVVPVPARRAPRKSGIISFDSAAITASAAQPVVAIVVKRLDAARGKVTVAWQVEDRTAGLGPGYEPVPPQVLRFFDGQTARSLFIPLVNTGAATMRGPLGFTVVLRAIKGGAAIGPIARVRVRLLPAL
ncbi:MAG: protein kinase [Gammaproteobacteria bacterium]